MSQNLGSSLLSEKLITKISNELCKVSSNNTSTTCTVIGVGGGGGVRTSRFIS